MPSTRESSLLFALDELRDIESQRKIELRHMAHEQAKERAQVVEEAARKQEEQERDAAEFLRLQEQHESDAKTRRILEAQIAAETQTTISLQSRVRLLESAATQPSPALHAQCRANRIHASWAIALLATCAAAFGLANHGTSDTPILASKQSELTPAPALAPDCPIATPASEAPKLAKSAETQPPHKTPRTRGKKTRTKAARGAAQPTSAAINIDECLDDPLGCMPK